jgi:HlyD family secretion protein
MNDESANIEGDLNEFLGQEPPGKYRRVKLWGGIAVVVLLCLLLLSRCVFGGASGQQYATAQAVRGDMAVRVTATGNLQPTNEISVGSEISGTITKVYVDENDRVTKGQPLAQIDPDKLIDAIHQGEAAVSQAKANVLEGQASVALSRAALGRLEEVERLSGGKVPSKSDLDTARAQYQRDVATLAADKAAVTSAVAQLATDQTNLAKATIRSPVNGVILSRQIEPGQTVAASFNTPTLFVIAQDLTQMKLEVKVDEADVGQVRAGQPASFTVDAYPDQVFKARIIRVNVGSNTAASSTGSSSTASSASSSTVVSYSAVLAVTNDDLALRPGMTATATILTSEQKNVLMVPNAALRFQPSKGQGAQQQGFSMFPRRRRGGNNEQQVGIGRGSTQTVYVLGDDGKLRPVSVRVGSTDGARTIITAGDLRPGMTVVTGELAKGE